MATYEITAPTGEVFEVTAPDDATEQQVMAYAKQNFKRPPKQKDWMEAYDPTQDMTGAQKFLAGAGKAFVDLGRGAGQILGLVDQESINESKKLDAPLMKTGAGMAGNLAGNVAATLPAAFVPGANTAVGATMIGSGLGALQPTGEGESRVLNTALGGALGFGGQQLGAKGIPKAINWAKGRTASAAAQKSMNVARDATIAEARKAGYVVPPSEVKPSSVSNLLEKWGGKAAVGQKASLQNQQVTNKLVRESLGLPADAPITPETLTPIKQAAWSVYDKTRGLGELIPDQEFNQAIAEIAKKSTKLNPVSGVDDLVARLQQGSFDADDVVTAIQTFKSSSSTRLGPMNTDPVSRNLGKAEAKAAEAFEKLIERRLGGDLLTDFRNARIALGKVGTVERALIGSTGDVNAQKLAAQMVKGKPLSDGLKTAAKFSEAFKGKYTQPHVNAIPGGSPLDMAGAAAGAATSAATGHPGFFGTALGYALGRPAARNAALWLSPKPNYSPGLLARAIPPMLTPLDNPGVAQTLGLLAPSIYAAQE